MSTAMRLKRFGTKKRPYYRIVVQDSRVATSSKTIDEVGTYRPIEEKDQIILNEEKVKGWIKKGVVVSPTVKDILNSQGITLSRTQD